MDATLVIGLVSIVTAGFTVAVGSIGPALGEGRAVAQALAAIAQQPDEAATLSRKEVSRQRQLWLAQVRAEADEARERWRAQLLQEQQDCQQTLHREASQRLLALARGALHDLADSEFEAQAVSVLLRRLQALDGESAQALADAAQEGCTVVSALPLPEPQRRTLTGGLRQALGPGLNPNFRSDPTAPWGITLETPSRRLSWNLDSYLDGFAAELEALIPEVAGSHHALVRDHA